MRDRRRICGLTLLEILVALAILLVGLYPLVETFRGGFHATRMSKEHGQAMLLADAVLEEVRARVTSGLGRYYGLADSGTTIKQRAAAGAWKSVFAPLAEGRKRVVSADPSAVSTYFAYLREDAADPLAARELSPFWTEVQVRFDVDGAPIDADGDGRAETDMCEVAVTVSWREGPGPDEQTLTLSSLFTREDFDRALEGQ